MASHEVSVCSRCSGAESAQTYSNRIANDNRVCARRRGIARLLRKSTVAAVDEDHRRHPLLPSDRVRGATHAGEDMELARDVLREDVLRVVSGVKHCVAKNIFTGRKAGGRVSKRASDKASVRMVQYLELVEEHRRKQCTTVSR